MSLLIAALNVQDLDNGYLFELRSGGPVDGVPVVSGRRVLIPGRRGFYTPADNFEDRHLLVRMHGVVMGSGATTAVRKASFAARMAALLAACDVAERMDVTLTADGYTINAGFLRLEGPPTILEQARELDIEFDATDPPEWEPVGS